MDKKQHTSSNFVRDTKILNIFFFFSSASIFIAALISTVFWDNKSPIAYYFLLITMLIFTWSSFHLFTKKYNPSKIFSENRIITTIFFALTIIAAISRFRGIATIPVWTDEDFHNMRLPRSSSIIGMAAWVNNPPIYYYYVKFCLFLGGRTPFAIRFTPAFFGSLSVPLFFSFLLKTCSQKKYAITGALVFLSTNWIVSYSKEAKGYTCGIFFFLLFLHALLACLEESNDYKNWVTLVCSSTLALLSIGLQPVLLLGCCSIIFPIYYVYKRKTHTAVTIWLALFTALIIFLPFQIFILHSTQEHTTFIKNTHTLYALRNSISLHFSSYIQTTLSLTRNGLAYLFPLIFFVTVTRFYSAKKIKSQPATAVMQFGVLCLTLLFPVFFFLIYESTIDSPLSPRYLLNYLPLYIASASYSLESLELWLCRWQKKYEPYITITVSSFVGILLITYTTLSLSDKSQKTIEYKWVKFYDFLRNSEDLHQAKAFILTFSHPPSFYLHGFLSSDFYYTNDLRTKVKLQAEWDVLGKSQVQLIVEALETKEEPSHIFFYYVNNQTEAHLDQYHYSSRNKPEVLHILESASAGPWDATVLKIKNKNGLQKTLENFFLDLEKQEPNKDLKMKVYEALAGIYAVQRNCRKAHEYIHKAKACFIPALSVGEFLPLCESHEWILSKIQQNCGTP